MPSLEPKQFKKDIKSSDIFKFYLFYGEESYLKEYYLNELVNSFKGSVFDDFNILKLEYPNFNDSTLHDFISSYPAMSDRKLLIISDMDLYKMREETKDIILNTMQDMPSYLTVVIYHDVLEFKADKRLKIHSIIDKNVNILKFGNLSTADLTAWITNRVKTNNKEIDAKTCNYLIFSVGNLMTNLITEIDKLCAFSSIEDITQKHIDEICSKNMEAIIFDMTDHLSSGEFYKAYDMIETLVLQKNEPVAICATIARHMSRLYGAKLALNSVKSPEYLMKIWGVRQVFYAKKMMESARRTDEKFLKTCLTLCVECDKELKSTSFDKQKNLEFLILKMSQAYKI